MFERLSIPTPFQVGPVNAYLAGRTLVDPGPDSDEAWAELLTHLEARELVPADVERVLVTHPHPDHFGLAHRFREEGATVYASEPAAEIVADFAGRLEYEQTYFRPFFEKHGVSEHTAETITELPEVFLQYAPPCETDVVLGEGDTVTVDHTDLRVEGVVGHAPGELIFVADGDQTEAVVGDNVLGDITPNPLLQPPADPSGARPRVLPAFNESLDRLADRDFDRFYPGHRELIEDPTGRIREIREAHEDRTAKVKELVDGPTTAVEVMEGLFGDLPATELFSGMSEAVGHLDVLEDRDEVRREENGGIVVYHPVSR